MDFEFADYYLMRVSIMIAFGHYSEISLSAQNRAAEVAFVSV